ncbi:hypothetical protein FB451DRAFT_1180782 [Mycena latifolia]|nr:hypothetical protein FB451DRAFT_1180782 [Mycena latifolia]
MSSAQSVTLSVNTGRLSSAQTVRLGVSRPTRFGHDTPSCRTCRTAGPLAGRSVDDWTLMPARSRWRLARMPDLVPDAPSGMNFYRTSRRKQLHRKESVELSSEATAEHFGNQEFDSLGVGNGTASHVVATRLTQDPRITFGVIEPHGEIVGGSSAINFMYLARKRRRGLYVKAILRRTPTCAARSRARRTPIHVHAANRRQCCKLVASAPDWSDLSNSVAPRSSAEKSELLPYNVRNETTQGPKTEPPASTAPKPLIRTVNFRASSRLFPPELTQSPYKPTGHYIRASQLRVVLGLCLLWDQPNLPMNHHIRYNPHHIILIQIIPGPPAPVDIEAAIGMDSTTHNPDDKSGSNPPGHAIDSGDEKSVSVRSDTTVVAGDLNATNKGA